MKPMKKATMQRKRDELIRQLREEYGATDAELEQALGRPLHTAEVIDAEVVELPDHQSARSTPTDDLGRSSPTDNLGSASRHPAEDSTARPHEDEAQGSTDGPIDKPEGGQEEAEAPAVCLPARIQAPIPPRWSEQWWEQASPEVQARRCKAHKKTGEQCLKAAIHGATVCRTHGGAAGHVKAAARARLENAADRMAANLLGLAVDAESEPVRLSATNSALDRAGLTKPTEVVLSPGAPKPIYETIFESIGGGTRAESRARRGVEDHSDTYGYDDPIAGQGASFLPTTEGDPRYATGPSSDGPFDTHPADSPRQPQRRRRDAPSTDDEALYLARLANERSGSLPAQRAITSSHRRYRRPW